MNENNQDMSTFPAMVAHVSVDRFRVVINRGEKQGIKEDQRFIIYQLSGEEIVDPFNGQSLGRLETVKGTGTVVHVQELMSTIESDMRKEAQRSITKRTGTTLLTFGPSTEETITPGDPKPFDSPCVGDLAKPI